MSRGVQHKLISRLEYRALDYCGHMKKYADNTRQERAKLVPFSHLTRPYSLMRGVTPMILGLHDESKNLGSALNAHSVVPIQLGPTDPQVPLANVEHKQHRCRYDDRVWPVAPTLGIGTTAPAAPMDIQFSSALGQENMFTLLRPNMPAPGMSYFKIGQSLSTKNAADIYYQHNGVSLDTNTLNFAFWGTGAKFTIQAGGNVGVGATSPANKFDVAGGMAVGATYGGGTTAGGTTAPSNGLIVQGNVGIGTNGTRLRDNT